MNSLANRLLNEKKITRHRWLYVKLRKIIPLVLIFMLLGLAVFNYSCRIHSSVVQHRSYDIMENSDNMESRFAERRERVKEKCTKLSISKNQNVPNASEFVIIPDHHLVWCNVFKAASSSWIYNFNILARYSPYYLNNTRQSPVQILRQKYPRPSVFELFKALNDSMSFLIVRHPFERLVSAYRDKFLNGLHKPYFRSKGREIIKATRFENENQRSSKIGKYSNNETKITAVSSKDLPTFPEFIGYILCQWRAGLHLDEHWVPITKFCTPCQVNFDIIIKFETLQQDQNYLIKLAKLENIIKPRWINRAVQAQTKDVIKDYYSQISRKQIQELGEVYKYDLELFQYSLDDYLPYGHNYDEPFRCDED